MAERPQERQQIMRFLALGASNTAVTFGVFFGLAQVWSAQVAYTVAFALGVVFAAKLTGPVVFRSAGHSGRAVRYAGWYVLVYAVGSIALHLAGAWFGARPALLGLAVVAGTAPLNYLGGRVIFRPVLRQAGSEPAA